MESYIRIGICLSALVAAQAAPGTDADAILTQADHYAGVGNLIRARPLYAQAEREFRARGDTRNALYAKFGRLRRDVESGSYTAVAQELERDLHNPVVQNDPALEIRALWVKGIIDLNLNTAAAREDFAQIQTLAKSIGDRKWENRAAGQLGIVAGVNGDVGAAGVALLKAMKTAASLNDVAAQISFSTWLANGMTVHGMPDRAIPVLDRALDLTSKEPDVGFPVQLYIAKIRALAKLPDGSAEAKRLIDLSLDYARKNQILGAQTELLNQAGQLAISGGDLAKAEDYFRETVAVAAKAQLPRMEAEGYSHLSEIHEQRREFAEAERDIDLAIARVRQVREDFTLPVYLARKAELVADKGSLRRADELYEQASLLIEAMLVNAPSSRVKSSMIAAMSDIYLGHFRLAVSRLQDYGKALRIIETARGRALADSIRYARLSTAAPVSTAAEQQIAAIQKRLRDSAVSPAETKLLLAKLEQTYDQLAPVEYKRNRAEMLMVHRPAVSLPQLQRALAPGEVLIEYVLDSKRNSFAFEITRDRARVHALPPRSEVSDLCQKYTRALKAKNSWADPGRQLFDRVVRPVVGGQPESVIIVPDGPLNLIPFAALQNAEGQYFARSTVVSLAPSATVFAMLRTVRRQHEPRKPFLGVAYSPGHPDVKPDPQYSASRSVDLSLAKLAPLPHAREEVQAGAKSAGADSVVLMDDAATESALKAEPLSDFKVIHLAAHGFSDLTEPDRAGLVLAPGDPNEDGLWQAREIREARLGADLVTLSACETGVGRLQGEEGIMNLARTFLVAGARSVVASLWDADDRSTATLMSHFYREIGKGRSVADALRAAQLAMMAEFGSEMQPYYWAGFTVIGDGNRKISFTKAQPVVEQPAGVSIR